MIKILLALVLGVALYLSLSYYQPVVEAQTIKDAEELQAQQYSFVSPIPYELVVTNK